MHALNSLHEDIETVFTLRSHRPLDVLRLPGSQRSTDLRSLQR